MIDVKNLIRELTQEQLLAAADGYFASMKIESEQCWKPFSNPLDATYLTRHLGWVLSASNLFRGAKVIDFGCGTGWLTHALAQMGCHATGVDISNNALQLARNLGERTRYVKPKLYGSATFSAYDGNRLPLENNSADRIICFDAFHHVRDQEETLREFSRVLKEGGRAAFLEPGPSHSKSAQSQAEMAAHAVIENDIEMGAISRFAQASGFDRPVMLIQYSNPVAIDVDDYLAWSEGRPPADLAKKLLSPLQNHITNAQCFFLQKGSPVRNSLQRDGLGARFELKSLIIRDGLIHFHVCVKNTGNRRWLSSSGSGQVNLGLQIVDSYGRMLNNDYGRVRLTQGDVDPGHQVDLSGACAAPGEVGLLVQLDMVSEMVCWFSDVGQTEPLKLLLPPDSL
jgi:SAM-dependent methyltransferase